MPAASTGAAKPRRTSASAPVPLSLIAHLLQVETDEGSFREHVMPLLQHNEAFQAGATELEALRRRFCHPDPVGLTAELPFLETHLREMLEDPARVPGELHWSEQANSNYIGRATWALCMRLCESCIDIAGRDAERGVAVARAAVAVAEHLSPHDYSESHRQQLQALAWAHVANAYRIPGHLRQARKCFQEVEARQARQTGDMAGLWAEVRCMQGSLLRDVRQLPEARTALEASTALAVRGGRPEFAGASLLSLASLDFEEGEVTSAVDRARQALVQLDSQHQPRWYAEACFNVAYYLSRAGEGATALDHLAHHQASLRQCCAPGDLARVPWMEGAALRALGRLPEAASKYEQARLAFLQLQYGPAAAVVTLELAIVHLEQGHTAEVKRLAAEILPVFEMQGIDREARATLELFRQAVAAEQLTLLQLRAWLGRLGVQA